MSEPIDVVDECHKIHGEASCSAVRIYNRIRQVGRGELTANNALHLMIEEYHALKVISRKSFALADVLKKKEGAK